MLIITTALPAEAKPLIEHLGLKQISEERFFRMYKNESNTIRLGISGIGKVRAATLVGAMMSSSEVDLTSVTMINVGICGAQPHINIGELVLVNKISDIASNRSFYPDLLVKHELPEAHLATVDQAVSGDWNASDVVDMEASGFFEAASRFLPPNRIASLKTVSDHFDPSKITRESVHALISAKMPTIEAFLQRMAVISQSASKAPIGEKEAALLNEIGAHLNLTTTLKRQLLKRATAFAIRNQKLPDLSPIFQLDKPKNKDERRRAFEHLEHYFA